MKKTVIVLALSGLWFPVASYAATSSTPAPQSVDQQWGMALGHHNMNISDKARSIACYSYVDCREKGKPFANIIVQGQDFSSASGYPSNGRKWSFAKGGYILKRSGNLD